MFSFGGPSGGFASAPAPVPVGGATHSVKWYYYLQNDPRRRLPDGWYEYDSHITLTVEQLYQSSHAASSSGGGSGGTGSNKRRHVLSMVASSGYQYELDFQRMMQRNMTSGKERPIFRTTNGQPPPGPPSAVAPFGFGGAAAAPPMVHGTLPAPAPHVVATTAASAVPAAPGPFGGFSFGGSARSSAFGSPGRGTSTQQKLLTYKAPELLHEVKVDEDKVFVDVPPPDGKPKAEEEKKNGSESSYSQGNQDDDCVICLDSLWGSGDRVVAIKNCGHRFHFQCIHETLTKMGGKCPLCSKSICQDEDAKTAKGKCPDATMLVRCSPHQHCQGYNDVGAITISYRIPGGTQKTYHPQPGFGFSGANRTAYLPDNQQGKDLLARMQFAFMHGLSFMVGTSLTTGQANTVTWASIHHKTNMAGGTYGFPDPTYFDRCNDELDKLDVPAPPACRTWLQKNCP